MKYFALLFFAALSSSTPIQSHLHRRTNLYTALKAAAQNADALVSTVGTNAYSIGVTAVKNTPTTGNLQNRLRHRLGAVDIDLDLPLKAPVRSPQFEPFDASPYLKNYPTRASRQNVPPKYGKVLYNRKGRYGVYDSYGRLLKLRKDSRLLKPLNPPKGYSFPPKGHNFPPDAMVASQLSPDATVALQRGGPGSVYGLDSLVPPQHGVGAVSHGPTFPKLTRANGFVGEIKGGEIKGGVIKGGVIHSGPPNPPPQDYFPDSFF